MTGHTHPLVSILVPCYRQAHYLEECLRSLCEQTHSAWEAIVVDDASPDGEAIASVVERIADPRVVLIRHPHNRGVSAARNTAAARARGQLLVCVDADDALHPTYLERLVHELRRQPGLEAAFTDSDLFGTTAGVKRYHVPTPTEILLTQPLHGPGLMMTRALWDRVGGFDESPRLRQGIEDWEFHIRVFSGPVRAQHVPEPLYRYRITGDGRDRSCQESKYLICQYIYEKHEDRYRRAGLKNAMLSAAHHRSALAAFQAGKRGRALVLSLQALRYEVSLKNLRGLARALLPRLVVDEVRSWRRTSARPGDVPAERR